MRCKGNEHSADCPKNYFEEYLLKVSPDFLWFDVQDAGSYSGSVYGVATYKKQIAEANTKVESYSDIAHLMIKTHVEELRALHKTTTGDKQDE